MPRDELLEATLDRITEILEGYWILLENLEKRVKKLETDKETW